MSIINKMHKDLQDNEEQSPILCAMPEKKRKQKRLLSILISLLLASSLGLSYLIYHKKSEVEKVAEAAAPVVIAMTTAKMVVIAPIETVKKTKIVAATPVPDIYITPVVKQKVVPAVQVIIPAITTPTLLPTILPTALPRPKIASAPPEKKGHLEIKESTLSTSQRVDIHLKRAEKARVNNDFTAVEKEKKRALAIKPDLHEVRKSLALYYYGIGESTQAINILKKGARTYPEYSDFNLMLSRIALKNGDQQKAYLYLNQHPPKVKGHIDYHVSYAILAQKFQYYEQAETLYQGLLTERPNNGRWMMSLAIAQDKLGKQSLAVENYQKALLQVDLSSKAKKYINQRLTYLAKQ